MGTQRHLYTDNYYTSVGLFKKLSESGVKATGTIRKNRINLPANFGVENLSKGQSKFYGAGAMMAVYWQDKKRVCVISTDGTTEIVADSKPKVIELYNKNMGGVDLFD